LKSKKKYLQVTDLCLMAWRYSVNLEAIKEAQPIENRLFLSSFITFVQKVWKKLA